MDQSIVETKSVIRLKYRTLWMICLVLLGILLTLNGLSYFVIIPQGYILMFFLPVFLFQALVIMDYNIKSGYTFGKKRGKPEIKVHLNPWVVIAGVVIALYFMVQFVLNLSFRGVPGIVNGQYIINNHGQHTVVSADIYRKALMSGQRSTSAIFIAFLYFHFGYFFSRKTRIAGGAQQNVTFGR